MPALPPITQEAWDQHEDTQFNQGARADLDALSGVQAEQQRVTQQRVDLDARDDADFQASARADLEGLRIAHARNRDEVAFQQQARADLATLRARPPQPGPSAPAMPGGTGTGLGRVYQDALASGLDEEGARAAVAVARTEGGMEGAQGDQAIGGSRGTFQLYFGGGMGNEYARSRGISEQQADAELAADPHAANRWALGGYLGSAIKEGQQKGLRGADLATYAQRHGQRSVSPERAGASYVALEGQSFDQTADSSPLGPPPTPGQDKPQYATARAVPRAEAVGQFEQGLDYAEAAAICGPVAALAFVQANGRNPSLAEVRALAKRRGWTEAGGMNGVANEQALLGDLGVKSRLDTDPDFGEIAADASSGNPVIISTPVHYYYASDFDPNTGKVFVGKTGTSRRGGGSWMTPQQIADLDGGINGVLYVDNPRSPEPSVAAGAATGEEEMPPAMRGVFTPPEDAGGVGRSWAEPTGSGVGGSWDPDRAGSRRLLQPGSIADSPAATIAAGVGEAAGTLGDLNAGLNAAADRQRDALAAEAGLSPETVGHAFDVATTMSGEPLKIARGAGRALTGAARLGEEALGQPGMSLEVTGEPGPARRLQDAVDDAATRATGGEVERLRLDKVPEEARPTVQRAAERGDFWRPQRRNVITDAEAERMADDIGRTVDEVIAGGRMGRAYNTEETRAIRNGVIGQALVVDDLKATVEALGDRASPALRRELGEEEARLLALSRVVEGARAEAGRTFRAYLADTRGRLLRSREPQYTSVSRVPTTAAPALGADAPIPTAARESALPGMADVPTTGRATNLVGETTTVGAPQPSLYDRFQTVRFAGMLSSTATQILNNTANAVNTLGDVGMKPLQVALDAGISKATGTERTRYLAEVAPQAKALVAGMLTGAKKIPHIMATGIDPESAAALDVPRGGLRSGSKVVDAVVEAPLRALSAADAMWRGGAYAGHAAALATRQAIKEGLRGAERATRVDHILSNLHEFKSIDDEARKLAARAVFQERRGGIDPAIALLKGTKAKYVSDVVLPFIRTPYNVAAQGAGMTPAGFVGALTAARAGQRGEAIDRAVRAGVGTAALGYGLSLAASGYVTGATPDDAGERSTLPDGWKPYSLRIPVEDGAVYVPLQMLGPLAMPLGIAGALGDLSRRAQAGADPKKLAYRSVSVLAKYVGDQAFLQGLAALPNIIEEPERYLERFLEGYAGSLMPASAAQRQIDQFLGRAPRDPRGALEGFLAASPLTSELVPARRTALGEERGTVSGPAALVAGTRITAERDDPALTALRTVGVGIPAPPKEIDGVPLTPDEQEDFRLLAGERVRAAVARVEANPRVAAMDAGLRRSIYESAVEGAREQARGVLWKRLGAEEIRRRRGATRVGVR